jgi:hypothetical protein
MSVSLFLVERLNLMDKGVDFFGSELAGELGHAAFAVGDEKRTALHPRRLIVVTAEGGAEADGVEAEFVTEAVGGFGELV